MTFIPFYEKQLIKLEHSQNYENIILNNEFLTVFKKKLLAFYDLIDFLQALAEPES